MVCAKKFEHWGPFIKASLSCGVVGLRFAGPSLRWAFASLGLGFAGLLLFWVLLLGSMLFCFFSGVGLLVFKGECSYNIA